MLRYKCNNGKSQSRGIVMEDTTFERIQQIARDESKRQGKFISASALIRQILNDYALVKGREITEKLLHDLEEAKKREYLP